MSPIIVTTGQRYCDIDALACVIAYCEINPDKYQAVIPGPLNHSVTQSIKRWGLNYQIKPPIDATEYVIMDISEDRFIADFVDIEKVIEIYDHHFGFESIWLARPYVKTKIEEIGACATLVWEEIKKRSVIGNLPTGRTSPKAMPTARKAGQLSEKLNPPINQSTNQLISSTSANLLYTAIVTHTLNFKISITKDRDRQAANDLKQFCNLPADWISQYYREIENDIFSNPQNAIINDTKIAYLGGQSIAIGQIEMWLPETFIKDNLNTIKGALRQFETELWLFSSPCISQGINYLLTENQSVKEWLKMHIGATFPTNGDLGYTNRLWLRKEILRELDRK